MRALATHMTDVKGTKKGRQSTRKVGNVGLVMYKSGHPTRLYDNACSAPVLVAVNSQ